MSQILRFTILWVATSFLVYTCSSARADVATDIRAEAVRQHFDPALAVAIATVESNLNEKAVGKLGEQGLFQLRPEFHGPEVYLRDGNIRLGIRYLAKCRRTCSARYGAEYYLCFNRGPNAKTLTRPTQNEYVKRVTAIYVEQLRATSTVTQYFERL